MVIDILNSILGRKKATHLSFEELRIVQAVVQQTVLSLDGLDGVSKHDKAKMAHEISQDLLEDMGILAPPFLIEIVVQATIRLLLELSSVKEPLAPVTFTFNQSRLSDTDSAA